MTDQDQPQDQPQDAADDAEAPAQTVTIEPAGPARKKLRIEIPPERIAAKLGENFQSLQDEAAIPGFRQGKAPMRLVERRFGSDVRKEVRSQLLGESFSQAVEDNKLRVIGDPDMKDLEELELPDTGPLSFEVEIEVVPDFELPDLSDIEVKKPLLEVTDDQIAGEIDRYRQMHGHMADVDGPAKEQDYLTADVDVCDESGQVLMQHAATPVHVPDKSRDDRGAVAGILVDELGKQLKGKKAGDAVELKTTGPEHHENEQLRDKPLLLKLNIQKVERLEPAPLDEMIGTLGLGSENEFREIVRQGLQQGNDSEQRTAMHQQICDTLIDRIEMELPEGISAQQAESTLQRRSMELMYRGMSQQDIEQHLAELRSSSQAEAQRTLKRLFILDRAAQQLEVQVSEAEINSRITELARQRRTRPEKLRQEMGRGEQLSQLHIQLREEKTVDQLLGQVKVVEVTAEQWRSDQGLPEPDEPKKKKKKTTKKKAPSRKSGSSERDSSEAGAAGKSAPRKKAPTRKKKKKTGADDADAEST